MTKLLFVFIAIFNYSGTKAQNSTLEQKNVSQSLLFHFNKNSYTAGDLLQFKCYIINTVDHVQDDNNLYIILSNKNGKFISKDKYPIFNSSVHGSIVIPKELVSGIYNIETFTPYLINNKRVKINQIIVKNTILQDDISELLCHVYYNDNRLVTRVPNTFFIKTEYPNSLPASCEVFITDKENKEQSRFLTDLNGIGKVTFMPLRNQLYNLHVSSNNRIYTFPLIKPDSVGIDMEVSCDLNIVNYKIIKNYQLQNNDDSFTVIITQRDKVVYKSEFSFEKFDIVTGGLRVENLHTGILKLSLVNKDGVTFSNRSIYLQNDRDFEHIQLKTLTDFKENRSKFDLSFSNKVNRFFSMAVEEVEAKDSVLKANSDFDFFYTSIFNNAVRNQVVDFYTLHPFNANPITSLYKIINPNTKQLLNTQSGNTVQPKLDDEYATIIRGKVYDSKGEKLFTNGTVNIFYNTADTTLNYNTKVNADGSFVLDSLIFSGTEKFYYKYYNPNNKEISCFIKLTENKTNSLIDSILLNEFDYKSEQVIKAETVKSDSTVFKVKLLNEVKIKSAAKTKKENLNALYTTGIYSAQSSSFIDNISNPIADVSMSGTEFVKNRILCLAFQKIQNSSNADLLSGLTLVNTKNFSLQTKEFWEVGIMIDEIPADVYDLHALRANDIAIVKFFSPGHVTTGMVRPGGLLAVYTKAKISNTALEKLKDEVVEEAGEQFFLCEGFSNKINISKGKTDVFRKNNSAYWNPSLILRKDLNNFSLETEKLEPGKVYKVSIRGYNELGQLINFETVLKN